MTTATHPALKYAPKTLRQALESALAYARSNKLEKNSYFQPKNGRHCIIGQFFTPKQLREIGLAQNSDGESLNGQDLKTVAEHFGRNNIVAMTGMTVDQAHVLQFLNDSKPQAEVIKWLETTLKDGKGEICSTEFRL